MIKKALFGIAVVVIVCVGALVYIAAPYLTTPTFSVSNSSASPVSVIAFWRDKSKDLGLIAPGEVIEFEVNDEAAIKFKAKYSSGKEVISEEMYFSSGLSIDATVTETGIELNYEPST